MKQFLLHLLRGYIIRKLRKAGRGNQNINWLLIDLGLPQTGLPHYQNPPPPPPAPNMTEEEKEELRKGFKEWLSSKVYIEKTSKAGLIPPKIQ